jgi:hypothetical protein
MKQRAGPEQQFLKNGEPAGRRHGRLFDQFPSPLVSTLQIKAVGRHGWLFARATSGGFQNNKAVR